MTGVVVGYDPGGNGSHGLALLDLADGAPRALAVATCADVEGVLRRVEAAGPILGLGVDTLTCWSTGPSGWRPADRWMRARYPAVQRSVASPNTLYGSMSLSGMAVLLALRARQPDLAITEAHPKVLHHALTGRRHAYAAEARSMDALLADALGLDVRTANDHEWDAVASALTALHLLRGTWTLDLHALPPADGERIFSPAGPTRYIWPDD